MNKIVNMTDTIGRPDWDAYFLTIARAVSARATCPRKRVGAVLVKNNRLIGAGYNGAPKGQPHCDDVGCLMVDNHCTRARHAEINALHYAVHSELEGAKMYVTVTPCNVCKESLKKYGVQDFVWEEDYP